MTVCTLYTSEHLTNVRLGLCNKLWLISTPHSHLLHFMSQLGRGGKSASNTSFWSIIIRILYVFYHIVITIFATLISHDTQTLARRQICSLMKWALCPEEILYIWVIALCTIQINIDKTRLTVSGLLDQETNFTSSGCLPESLVRYWSYCSQSIPCSLLSRNYFSDS